MRNGQAGFFTDDELAASAGVLWDPASADAGCDGPASRSAAGGRDPVDAAVPVRAFAAGDGLGCFGPGFERSPPTPGRLASRTVACSSSTRSTDFEPKGGPWGRGYLRADDRIQPDDWFFDGHFKNDPCMPGTLMFEGCLQAMAIYLTALGFTLDRDGWRFEPAVEERYQLRCRGQVLPSSQQLIYEVFVEEVVDGPTPTVYADLLCTVDGLKVFHAVGSALRLVPDWPLEQSSSQPGLLVDPRGTGGARSRASVWATVPARLCVGSAQRGLRARLRVFDNHRRVARLPGPPYHFMTRVERDRGRRRLDAGRARVEVAYDVPADAWYFERERLSQHALGRPARGRPAALWLARVLRRLRAHQRSRPVFPQSRRHRDAREEVLPSAGTLRTRARMIRISSSAGMIIDSFEVECLLGESNRCSR